jgi:hypothetical protein
MTGKDGDFYFNSTTGAIFKKEAGVWIFVCNIADLPIGFTGNIKIHKVTLHVRHGIILGYN